MVGNQVADRGQPPTVLASARPRLGVHLSGRRKRKHGRDEGLQSSYREGGQAEITGAKPLFQ